MLTILIADENSEKFRKISAEFADLPFRFVGLVNLKLNKRVIKGNFEAEWENALGNAKYYAKKAKLLTIYTDVDSGCVYDPENNNFSVFTSEELGTFGVINQIKHYLQKQYSFKQLLVPIAIIVKEGKILSTKRRDPARPEFNNKWEFPGGIVENGESCEECVIREVKEETGYNINIMERLPEIYTTVAVKYGYQVHSPFYICRIKSGKFTTSDTETSGYGWFSIEKLLKLDLLPMSKKCIQSKNNQLIIKKYARH